VHIIKASGICKEKLQNQIVASTYILGHAVKNNLLPIEKGSVLKAIENIIPEKYREINVKAFNLAFSNDN